MLFPFIKISGLQLLKKNKYDAFSKLITQKLFRLVLRNLQEFPDSSGSKKGFVSKVSSYIDISSSVVE